MKKQIFTIGLILTMGVHHSAFAENETDSKSDTIRSQFLQEVVVTSSIKETNSLKSLPGAASVLSPRQLSDMQISDIVDVSTIVPNFFIPDYGSKYTSPVYIRGIGNRSTGQATGMYIDNVPLINKSTYDFDFLDVQRLELLRGPQGTLYGRNAMGGIINVFTHSPLTYQQTNVEITGGNYGLFRAKAANNTKVNDRLGFSLSGYYEHSDGYFTNEYTGKKADTSGAGGGRFRLDYQISNSLRSSLILNYDYSDQGAYPYSTYNKTTGTINPINYNEEGSYLRKMGYAALNLEYKNEHAIWTSNMSYQGLNDQMRMDQDYSPASVYNIYQKQNQGAFTEEITVKSNTKNNYQWSFGAFGFSNRLNTDVDVNFEKDGVKMIQGYLGMAHTMGAPTMVATGSSVPVPGRFETPGYGGAIFHQSTYNNLFIEGLSITAGIRLDYEKDKLDYNTSTSIDILMPGLPPVNTQLDTVMTGKLSNDFIQVLPRVALKYDFDSNSKQYVYASASKGYNPGGYNIQALSELVLMAPIMGQVPGYKPVDVTGVLPYDPEYSWNYEIGYKGELISNILSTEIALFYIDVEDMQLTQFVAAGRKIANAGKAINKGFDISLNASITPEINAGVNYGYTHATFDNYNNGRVDYSGKYLPYVPQNTFSVYGSYNKWFTGCWIDQLNLMAQYNGAGRMYWTEANDTYQDFYGLLNVKAGVRKGIFAVDVWAKNALNQKYNTFYFEMNKQAYLQQGNPATFGVDLKLSF